MWPAHPNFTPGAGDAGKKLLELGWLGKRCMTDDFAAVVHRMKLLGFNAVRLQFV